MAHRLKEGQEKHDAKVATIAASKARNGYTVQADLPGHAKPSILNGHRPDVIAIKAIPSAFGGKKLIEVYEVETRIGDDVVQHAALRSWATRNGAIFQVVYA